MPEPMTLEQYEAEPADARMRRERLMCALGQRDEVEAALRDVAQGWREDGDPSGWSSATVEALCQALDALGIVPPPDELQHTTVCQPEIPGIDEAFQSVFGASPSREETDHDSDSPAR